MRLLREPLFHFLIINALNDRNVPIPAGRIVLSRVRCGSGGAVDLKFLNVCFGEITGDGSCKLQILGFHSSIDQAISR
jgi:hypothetical protein